MTKNKTTNADKASQTYCQAGVEPHNYSSYSVPSSKHVGWIRVCESCRNIDGEDLDREVSNRIRQVLEELMEQKKTLSDLETPGKIAGFKGIEAVPVAVITEKIKEYSDNE